MRAQPAPAPPAVTQWDAAATVLGVWAHPDDEASLSSGLMGRVRDAGGRVLVVTATRGEHGTDDPRRWPPDRLGRLREQELKASLAEAGVHEQRWLSYRDGELARATLTPEFHREWGELNDRVGLWAGQPPVTATGDLVARVRLSGPALVRKHRALRAHASQTRVLEDLVGAATYRRWWSNEFFVAAERR